MTKQNHPLNMRMATKSHNRLLKLETILCLLISLLAFRWCNKNNLRPIGQMDAMVGSAKNIQALRNTIAMFDDISCEIDGTTWLHAAVRSNDPEKVKVVLGRINEDKKKRNISSTKIIFQIQLIREVKKHPWVRL